MTSLILPQVALIAIYGCGTTIAIYDDIADERGWPVGRWMRGPKPAIAFLAWLSILASLGLSAWLLEAWWRIFVTLVGGMYTSKFLLYYFGPAVQPIVLLALPVSWLGFVYVFVVW